ncbi:C-C motif chemokine 17 [Tiliqua scincoides]|uniref:C-C motif chemokine 17 n=1 Tax=Tiliqua scincoides TaxID=71010 RepID=UPI0034627C44
MDTVSSLLREEEQEEQKSPALAEDITMSLKTALLVALILALSYHHVAALYPGTPKECCDAYRTGKQLSYTIFRSYYRTSRDCFLNAIVLVTKTGKRICFNPAERWVRQTMRRLQEKK